ncbi:hypothetical protein M5D96_008992, partial [Drosophila gunungcola]
GILNFVLPRLLTNNQFNCIFRFIYFDALDALFLAFKDLTSLKALCSELMPCICLAFVPSC